MTDTATIYAPVKEGDIFVSSWGYDQTNIDFYEVVKVTPSGKSVWTKRISQEFTEQRGAYGDKVVAVPGSWSETAEPKLHRLKYYDGEPQFRVASYASAWLWDGTPRHQTAFGFGH